MCALIEGPAFLFFSKKYETRFMGTDRALGPLLIRTLLFRVRGSGSHTQYLDPPAHPFPSLPPG